MQRRKIIIDFYSAGNRNVGVGEYSYKLAEALYAKASALKERGVALCYIVPRELKGHFGDDVEYLVGNKFTRSLYRYFPYRCDLFHAVHQFCLVKFMRSSKKSLLTLHDINFIYEKKGRKIEKYRRKIARRMSEADRVVVISRFVEEDVRRLYPELSKPVSVIYNGVSQPEVCDFPEYFDELGIEKGRYILGMCRFVPEKNLHHLVEAYCKIKNEQLRNKNSADGVKLVLAGDTDFEDDYSRGLKEMARRNGVVLTGFVKGRKLHSLLTNCRCYCLPSSHEGLPIALLEAMSYGVKVIVSDIPANLEVGLNKEDYFPVGNVDMLAERLKTLMERPLEHVDYDMGKYDWEKIADQMAEVYRDIVHS